MDYILTGILAALLLSAWFAGAETTFLSYNKVRFQAWLHGGVRGTRAVDFLSRNPERFLITTLTGNNLVNVLYSSLVAVWLARHGFSERVILIAAPLVLLVFGETIPKAIARQLANRSILVVGNILYWLRGAMWPFVGVVEALMNRLQKRLGLPHQTIGEALTRAEIADVLVNAGREGQFPVNTLTMLRRFFSISERRVKDIMTPRTAIVALAMDTSLSDARRKVIDSGFTRLPCYRDSIDEVEGVLVAHDLLKNPPNLTAVIRPLPMVPVSLPVVELVPWMNKRRCRLAGVVDEYGGLAGIVSSADIARELVGMIEDEYDVDDRDCIRLSDKIWLAQGRMRMSLLNQVIGFEPLKTKAASLGGAVMGITGGIPAVGDEFDLPEVKLRVIRADRSGVYLVRLTIKETDKISDKA